LIDIILVFFTAVDYDSINVKTREFLRQLETVTAWEKNQISNVVDSVPVWETDMRLIALNYIFNFFTFDILACIPGLLTYEKELTLYPFKILRIFRLPRLLSFIESLFNSYK